MELDLLRDLILMCGEEVGGGMHAQLRHEDDAPWEGDKDGSTLHPTTTALKQTYMELSGLCVVGDHPRG